MMLGEVGRVTCIGVTYNCIETDYPVKEVIESYWNSCHEIVIVDACSTDGTLELLQDLQCRSPIPFIIVAHFPYEEKQKNWWLRTARAEGYSRSTSEWVWMIDMDEFLAKPITDLQGGQVHVTVHQFEDNPWYYTDEYTIQTRIVRRSCVIQIHDHCFMSVDPSLPSSDSGAVVLHYSSLRHKGGLHKKVMRILNDWHEHNFTDEKFEEWYENRSTRRNATGTLYTGPIPLTARKWLMERDWTEEDFNARPVH